MSRTDMFHTVPSQSLLWIHPLKKCVICAKNTLIVADNAGKKPIKEGTVRSQGQLLRLGF